MISIVLAIILGLIFTLVAVQNPTVVTVNAFTISVDLPLYVIAALSFLGGVFITLIFSLFETTTTALDIHSRDSKIHNFQKLTDDLQSHMSNLREENTKLKEQLRLKSNEVRQEKVAATKQNIRDWFGRLRHTI